MGGANTRLGGLKYPKPPISAYEETSSIIINFLFVNLYRNLCGLPVFSSGEMQKNPIEIKFNLFKTLLSVSYWTPVISSPTIIIIHSDLKIPTIHVEAKLFYKRFHNRILSLIRMLLLETLRFPIFLINPPRRLKIKWRRDRLDTQCLYKYFFKA